MKHQPGTMGNILDDIKGFVKQAKGNDKIMPGSENTKDVPGNPVDPTPLDPELNNGVPAGVRNNQGAGEPVTPTAAPLKDSTQAPSVSVRTESDGTDALNCKLSSADLANDLLTDIGAFQKKAADEAASSKSTGRLESSFKNNGTLTDILGTTPPTSKPPSKVAPATPKLAPAKVAPATPETEGTKEAGTDERTTLELSQSVLAKIACELLQTEEGAGIVQEQLAKTAGAKAAESLILKVAEAAEYQQGVEAAGAMIKQAHAEQGYNDAGVMIQSVLDEMAGEKTAAYTIAKLAEEIDAMGAMGAMEDMAGAPMPEEAGAEMGVAPEGDLSIEELLAMLQSDPELLAELQAYIGEVDGAAPEGAMPPEAAPAEEAVVEDPMTVEASAPVAGEAKKINLASVKTKLAAALDVYKAKTKEG